MLHALLVYVFARLDASFQINLATLTQILPCHFSLTAIQSNIVPFRAFLALSRIAAVPRFAGRTRKIAHRFAIGHITHFCIAPKQPIKINLFKDILNFYS